MIEEYALVALTRDIEFHDAQLGSRQLQLGDVGTVVHCYEKGEAYEVEFVAGNGRTLALLTLTPSDIKTISGNRILHIRELNSD